MDTMDSVVEFFWSHVKALKPSFISKKPHFSFISAHCESMRLLVSMCSAFPY